MANEGFEKYRKSLWYTTSGTPVDCTPEAAWNEATRQAKEHERLAVEQAASVTVERCVGVIRKEYSHCRHDTAEGTELGGLLFSLMQDMLTISPDNGEWLKNYVERKVLEARIAWARTHCKR